MIRTDLLRFLPAAAAALTLAACTVGSADPDAGASCPDLDGDGFCDPPGALDGGSTESDAGRPDGGPPPPPPDSGPPDGGVDAGRIVMTVCPPESIVPEGCVADVDEGEAELCNGADDDCDGAIDEGCPCSPGAVQRCFAGPPGRRDVGACEDGTQTCSEFGWGECIGGIRPSVEACDDLDNDCNGCTDEVEGCVPVGSCPGPGDPRVSDATPFSSYPLDGSLFYSGSDAIGWRWEVEGTPCDRMFQAIPGSTATSENGQLSYRVNGASSRNATLETTLSGDYTVTLTVTRSGGADPFVCTWIVHVGGPGVRVELCWDETGPTAGFFDTVDLDLHLGKTGTTSAWFTDDDCYYANCDDWTSTGRPAWGYPNTPAGSCVLPPGSTGQCWNPRLDIDNVAEFSEYVPENINVDNPADGDAFRVLVNYFSGSQSTYPLVNVYCGGEITATFGAAPDRVTGFTSSAIGEDGLMWRVADITTRVDASGTTTGCDVTALHPPGTTSGYWLTTGDTSY